MSAVPVVPIIPVRPAPVSIPVNGSSATTPPPSFWDRASTWVSENKAIVYTVGAVAVVITGAGVVYYLSQPNGVSDGGNGSGVILEKKKSKKDRRKAKRQVEEPKKDETPAAPAPSSLKPILTKMRMC